MVSYSEGKISSVDRLTRITLQIIHEKWQRRKAGNSGFLVTLEALKALSGARPLQKLYVPFIDAHLVPNLVVTNRPFMWRCH